MAGQVHGTRGITRGPAAAPGVELDVPERIRALFGQTNSRARIGRAVATELSLLFYAVASWRRRPFVADGARGFSYHRRNALASILYTVILASIVEMAAVHVLLRQFAPRVALGVLALSVMGAFWLLGFVRAVQLRPIMVTTDFLLVRTGVLWTVDVARANIATIAFGRVQAPAKGTPGYLRATFGNPNVLIELHAPAIAQGAYGTSRAVTRLALVIDDVDGFRALMS